MKAYSLLEFLLAASLSLALLYQGALSLFSIEQAALAHFRHAYESAQLKRAQSLAAIATYTNDEQRLAGLLQVLPDADFSKLKNPPKQSEHQLAQKSNLLYNMELESKELFVMESKKRENFSNGIEARVCRRSPGQRRAFSTYALAIGIHAQHCVRIASGAYPRRCGDMRLEPWPCFASLAFAKPPHLFDAQALIPIQREYLLYASKGAVFRYLGLEGLFVVENQPVAEALVQAFFEIQAAPQHANFFTLQANMLSRSKLSLHLAHEQHLAPISPVEFLTYALAHE